MIILTVDIGLRESGYVVCDTYNNREVVILDEGTIKPRQRLNISEKIFFIYQRLKSIVETFSPKVLVLEKLYSHYRHPFTLEVLGQVKGIVMLLGAEYKLEVVEFTPTKARKAFMGKGNADSAQVRKMAESILGRKMLSKHTADAFSLAVAYSRYEKTKRLLRK